MSETTNQGYSDRQFLHTQTAAVTVPLMQSGVTGLIVMAVAMVLFAVNRARDWWTAPVVLGVLAFGLMWLTLTRRWMWLTSIEQVVRYDLNQDGVIGQPVEPAPAQRFVKVQISQVKDNGHYQADIVELPEAQLEKFAGLIQAGVPFAEAQMAGKGKPFSVPEYRKFCHELLKRGLIQYRNEAARQQGYEFTEAGRALVDQYPPLPHEQA